MYGSPKGTIKKWSEEFCTAITTNGIGLLGKQIRIHPSGSGYARRIATPYANISTAKEQIKVFYFAT